MTPVLHELLERYPGAALEISEGGVVIGTNRMLDELVGRDLVGIPLSEVLDESSQNKWQVVLTREPSAPNETYICELAFRTPQSMEARRFICIRGVADPLHWLIEQPRDPKMEQLYQELASLNSDLSTMQREVARERSRLVRALDEAKAAVRTRDDVLAVVSHDLRNPMNTIRMAAGLLELNIAEDKKQQQVGAIIRSVDRMTALIGDLLDVSAIEAGQFQIEAGPVDLAGLLEELCALHETQASAKNQRLQCRLIGQLPVITGDYHRLLQALSNLLGNAIKFTGQNGLIVIQARRTESEVLISVEDDGPGIHENDVPHVFDRYWHANRKNRGGTGLGLAITKGIIDAHRGRIWVERAREKGTQISFAIPLSPEGKALRAGLTLSQ